MENLTISEVARMAGIQPSALRYYESIGLIQLPRRINGKRLYGPEAIQRLALVQLAQQAGFTIAEIQTLFNGFAPDTPPAARWRTLACQKVVELDASIARAQRMKQVLETGLQCGCLRLEDCPVTPGDDCCCA
jgi:MerR family redox-sensitive transcriptional activator SoxR